MNINYPSFTRTARLVLPPFITTTSWWWMDGWCWIHGGSQLKWKQQPGELWLLRLYLRSFYRVAGWSSLKAQSKVCYEHRLPPPPSPSPFPDSFPIWKCKPTSERTKLLSRTIFENKNPTSNNAAINLVLNRPLKGPLLKVRIFEKILQISREKIILPCLVLDLSVWVSSENRTKLGEGVSKCLIWKRRWY